MTGDVERFDVSNLPPPINKGGFAGVFLGVYDRHTKTSCALRVSLVRDENHTRTGREVEFFEDYIYSTVPNGILIERI